MMGINWPEIHGNVGIFTNYLSLGTFLLSAYIAFRAWRRHKAYKSLASSCVRKGEFKELYDEYKDKKTANPWVLSVNLLPDQHSCIPDIQSYYKERGEMCPPFVEINIQGITKMPDDMEMLMREIREKRIFFDQEVVTEVNLFYAGPVCGSFFIGAALDNWKVVKIFKKEKERYEYWGIL